MKKSSTGFFILVILTMMASLMISIPKASINQRPTIKIGTLGPMAIIPGIDMNYGVDLAVDEINDGEGVVIESTAYDFEVIKETTSGIMGFPDATTALFSLTKLQDEDNVVAIIGGFRGTVVVNIQYQLDRPFLIAGSLAPLISEYSWRVGFTNRTQLTTSLVDLYAYGLSNQELKNVTIVREDAVWTLAMSKSIKGYLNTDLPASKGTTIINFTDDIVIAESATYDMVNSSLTPLKTEYQGLNVNALMTIISGPIGRYVTKVWGALNLSQVLAGINIEAQSGTYLEDTEGAAAGEVELEFCPPDINQTSKTGGFRQAYYVKTGKTPSAAAVASYDAVYVLKDAIERAGSTEAETLQTALVGTDHEGAAYKIKFTSEPGSQKGVDGSGNPILIPGAPEDITVHDLYTTATVGVNGQPYMQGYYVRWQENGTRKTIWGHEPRLPETSTSETSTSETSTTGTSTAGTSTKETSTVEASTQGSPGFESLIGLFVLGNLALIVNRQKRKKFKKY
ncbi:MAG: ABC transporter substrate-binding protein [Candidatus Hodarchaeales archaeon]|jgi:branched-chain amino acid transport system substrate-binding protein